jgi:hypothetical protein
MLCKNRRRMHFTEGSRADDRCLERVNTNEENTQMKWSEVKWSEVCFFSFIWIWVQYVEVTTQVGSNYILSRYSGGPPLATSRCWPKLMFSCLVRGQSSKYYVYQLSLRHGHLKQIFRPPVLSGWNTIQNYNYSRCNVTVSKKTNVWMCFGWPTPFLRAERHTAMRKGIREGNTRNNFPFLPWYDQYDSFRGPNQLLPDT